MPLEAYEAKLNTHEQKNVKGKKNRNQVLHRQLRRYKHTLLFWKSEVQFLAYSQAAHNRLQFRIKEMKNPLLAFIGNYIHTETHIKTRTIQVYPLRTVSHYVFGSRKISEETQLHLKL